MILTDFFPSLASNKNQHSLEFPMTLFFIDLGGTTQLQHSLQIGISKNRCGEQEHLESAMIFTLNYLKYFSEQGGAVEKVFFIALEPQNDKVFTI